MPGPDPAAPERGKDLGDRADSTLDIRLKNLARDLAPAEQRMARFFADQKQAVLLKSAAEIAELAGASDATVVRTAQSLGFSGLSDLRQALLAEITGSPSPSKRLALTLGESGDSAAAALRHVVDIHESALAVLKMPETADSFARAVDILGKAPRRHIFGIGPSGAVAEYATLQFNRIGLQSSALTVSGIALADRLLGMGTGDAVLMLAYAPLYREVEIVLDEAGRCGAPVVLVSDSLGPLVSGKVAEILPVPRGKADHLAMHGATFVLIEALITALAGRNSAVAFDSLEQLSSLRSQIDRDWKKRGMRKK